MAKISVIIPVYNVENYIHQCIQSVINQTLSDIEIILMDDGSRDESTLICCEYASKDSRIKVIHHINEGVCKTRNEAVKVATAKYITYVDSDDWLPAEACERMYDAASKNDSDMVIGNYVRVSGSIESLKRPYTSGSYLFEENDVKEKLLPDIIAPTGERMKTPNLIDTLLTCSAKLYRREIILDNDISWIDRKTIYSDCLDFILDYTSCCKRVMYIDMPLYYYRRDNVTSQTTLYRKDIMRLWKYQFNRFEEIKKSRHLDTIDEAVNNRICFTIIPIGGNLVSVGNKKREYRECKEILNDEVFEEPFEKFECRKLPFYYRPLFVFAEQKKVVAFLVYTHFMRFAMKILNK